MSLKCSTSPCYRHTFFSQSDSKMLISPAIHISYTPQAHTYFHLIFIFHSSTLASHHDFCGARSISAIKLL